MHDASGQEGEDAGDDEPADEEPGEKPLRPKQRNEPEDPSAGYKMFTRAHDEEIAAEDLCDGEELSRLRGYLDQQLKPLQSVVGRLANRLHCRNGFAQAHHPVDGERFIIDDERAHQWAWLGNARKNVLP